MNTHTKITFDLVPGYSTSDHLADDLITYAINEMEGRKQTRRNAKAALGRAYATFITLWQLSPPKIEICN